MLNRSVLLHYCRVQRERVIVYLQSIDAWLFKGLSGANHWSFTRLHILFAHSLEITIMQLRVCR